jgi:hypothetical protein
MSRVFRQSEKVTMTDKLKETAKKTAVAILGAGFGGAGGASVGVLELAALGIATELSAGVVIAAGAAAGAGSFLAGYRIYRFLTRSERWISRGWHPAGGQSRLHNGMRSR